MHARTRTGDLRMQPRSAPTPATTRPARQHLLRGALPLLLWALAGCATTAPVREEIPPFRQGVATANQQTAAAFADINTFLRAQQVDRAVSQPTLNESMFVEALPASDTAKWSRAFALIDAYAARLEQLLDPQRRASAETELSSLGEAIGRLDGEQLPAGVAAGFIQLGGLLVQLRADKDALASIRAADPGIQQVFAQMMAAIGSGPSDAIRGTVRTSWQQILGGISVAFLSASGPDAKRSVVLRYVDTLDQRDSQDRSLAALRSSIGLLASAHSELAAGRHASSQQMLELLQNEYTAYRQQVETIRTREAGAAAQPGGGA
jgi:hypothetical protein